jgi:hypothetical protein
MPTTCCQSFRDVSTVTVKVKLTFPTLVRILNQNCSGTKILFNYVCWFNLLNINVSRTFDNDSNSDIDL